MSFVSFKNVYKRYHMGEVTITASDGVTFDIEKGEFAVIVGASGTGKTTIAKELFSDCYVKDLIYTASSVIDDMPKNVAVVQRAIAELEKYKKAFELACREVASYTVCIWCDDNSGCDNCKILQSIKAKFLGWTEADDE